MGNASKLPPMKTAQDITDLEAHICLALDQPLHEFAAAHRNDGKSWPAIVIEIYKATGVSVTEQTLRRWNDRWQFR